MSKFLKIAASLALLGTSAQAEGFGLGREALPKEIAAWDVSVRPDGTGLPEGSGDVWTGEEVFADKCAVCHGDFAEGVGNWPKLAGGWDTLDRKDPVKTVGSYWPYLSTTWDYINRSMPFGDAQTLEPDEVYAMVAYILYSNDIVDDDFVLSKDTFLDVEMPNADGFFVDDRDETEYAQWSGEPCMENCKDNVEVTMRAVFLDVTPGVDEAATSDGQITDEPAQAAATTEDTAEEPAEEVAEQDSAAPDPELVAAGEKVFRKCAACHQVGEGAKNRVGPTLNGIVGHPAGQVDGFRYSNALTDMADDGLVWDDENLRAFLADPRGFMKGTKMSFAGLRKDDDLDAILAYLASFAG
ncbi:MFS transporter [Pelagivirga sediminicola]|uniref:MFS transporter n=1 Tax=Pelagivirga sediminicola TaxID=2170575 RepID=A0A2T7G8H2_9RHOB|nr:c-type cytochrome [Pelagivirga sediminicola]PVA10708.1 MFS transporter [Pelagivirga sediminicola]